MTLKIGLLAANFFNSLKRASVTGKSSLIEIVIKLDWTLNLVSLKSCHSSGRQFEREGKEHISQVTFGCTDRARLHGFIRRDSATAINSASRIGAASGPVADVV